MGFVGPAHRLGDSWVRPHDVEVSHEPNGQTIEALIDRVVHLGFEVRWSSPCRTASTSRCS